MQFDAEITALLDRAYRGRDFAERRQANLAVLDPAPGDHVLDLGCGPGFLLPDLAGAVGPKGHVTGLDPSAGMLERAGVLVAGAGTVSLMEGNGAALPIPDGSLDGIVSIQVFEYIEDIAAALAECHRALKPGGRIVIGDMHFGTMVWDSDDPDRMARVLAAYDRHVPHPHLPAQLPRALRAAGFAPDPMRALTFVDHELRPDGLARMTMALAAAFLRQAGLLPDAEIDAWTAEQEQRRQDGRFFFSLTHFIASARRL